MTAFNKAWSVVKFDDSDCDAVWDLVETHQLNLGHAVYKFGKLTGLSREEQNQLKQACIAYRDEGKWQSANLPDRY